MILRVTLPLEVEQTRDGLGDATPVSVQFILEHGKWRAQCTEPPIATLQCDTFEEAVRAAGREIVADWASQQN